MLANGNVPVAFKTLPGGWQGTDQTVALMEQLSMGQWGARSPKIHALALNIVRAAGVPEKDYVNEMVAIHNWVRDNVRYTKDVQGQETLYPPEEVAFNSRAGDCLTGDTRLLTPAGYKAIKDIKPGHVVQGRSGWTKVLKWWDKGVLPVRTYVLDNGGEFTATDDHRCFTQSGAEVRAADLVAGTALLGPSDIALSATDSPFTEQDCYFVGIFLADGWVDGNRICVAGKDGFAKEQQKRWAADYAAGKGWQTSWHPRYLRIYVPKSDPLHALLYSSDTAEGKEVPAEIMASLTPASAKRLLDGLLSDSHHPMITQRALDAVEGRKSIRRSGMCYSTISNVLAKQVRLLFRYQGVSVRDSLIVDHGGLGTHPVHRIYPRYYRPKPARIESIEDAGDQHVYDIETADHGIYLPDADVVVHNCDDKSMLVAALLGSIGTATRFVTIGVTPDRFSHVYLQARPKNAWISLDPIMRDKPAGWEVPASAVKVRKVFPENAAQEMNVSRINGLGEDIGSQSAAGGTPGGARGSSPFGWHVGFQGGGFTHSHLSPDPKPKSDGSAPYIITDSMSDSDLPIEQLSINAPAFPQQDTNSIGVPALRNIAPTVADRRVPLAQTQTAPDQNAGQAIATAIGVPVQAYDTWNRPHVIMPDGSVTQPHWFTPHDGMPVVATPDGTLIKPGVLPDGAAPPMSLPDGSVVAPSFTAGPNPYADDNMVIQRGPASVNPTVDLTDPNPMAAQGVTAAPNYAPNAGTSLTPAAAMIATKRARSIRSTGAVQAQVVQDDQMPDGFMSPNAEHMNGVIGPDQLSGMGDTGIDRQLPYAHMQRPGLAQKPEGIDSMFTRPNMVLRTDRGDTIVYKGLYSLSEKPPIRPYHPGVDGFNGVQGGAGMGMMPARSISGPGVAELADAAAAAPIALPTQAPVATPSSMPKVALFAAACAGAYLLLRKRK